MSSSPVAPIVIARRFSSDFSALDEMRDQIEPAESSSPVEISAPDTIAGVEQSIAGALHEISEQESPKPQFGHGMEDYYRALQQGVAHDDGPIEALRKASTDASGGVDVKSDVEAFGKELDPAVGRFDTAITRFNAVLDKGIRFIQDT